MTGFDPLALLRALADAGVRFIVVGGFAVIAHGVVRATKDLNVSPTPTRRTSGGSRPRCSTSTPSTGLGDFAAEEMPVALRDPEAFRAGGNLRLQTKLGVLDVIQWLAGLPEHEAAYAVLARRAIRADVGDLSLLVAALPDLITMKSAAGRPQDLEDLRLARSPSPRAERTGPPTTMSPRLAISH